MNKEITKLDSVGLIRIQHGQITQVEDSIHLPAESKYSFINHLNWRLKTIQKIESRESQENDYNFSAVFSANDETKKKIKKIILDSIVQVGESVNGSSKTEKVYHLGIDLWES